MHPRRTTTAFVGDRNTETHFTAENPKTRQGRDTAMTGRVRVRWAPQRLPHPAQGFRVRGHPVPQACCLSTQHRLCILPEALPVLDRDWLGRFWEQKFDKWPHTYETREMIVHRTGEAPDARDEKWV